MPHHFIQLISFLQYLPPVSKAQYCRQQATDLNILLQYITVRKLYRITFYNEAE